MSKKISISKGSVRLGALARVKGETGKYCIVGVTAHMDAGIQLLLVPIRDMEKPEWEYTLAEIQYCYDRRGKVAIADRDWLERWLYMKYVGEHWDRECSEKAIQKYIDAAATRIPLGWKLEYNVTDNKEQDVTKR